MEVLGLHAVAAVLGGALLVLLRHLDRAVLELLVDRRRDAQAAALHLRLGEAELLELVLDHLDEVALRAAVAVVDRHVGERRQLGPRFVVLRLGDGPHLEHPVEHVAVPAEEALAVLLTAGGVEGRRVVEDRGERRGLGDVEVLRLLQEVRLGRGLDAVGAAAEVDRVEVAGEHLLLRHVVAHLDREHELADLALQRALGVEVEDLDVLLGDRRAALHLPARGDRPRGARDRRRREAGVVPERPVLRRDHRVLGELRDVLVVERLAVLHRERAELRRAVVVVDERGVGLETLVGVRDLRGLVQVEERAEPEQRHHQHGDDQPEPQPSPDPAATALLAMLRHRHPPPRRGPA
nr:hypothetical protein [uncultured Tessaracoccus sp.]